MTEPNKTHELHSVGNDPAWTLKAWADFLQEMIAKYGPHSILYTNAGHNNVDLVIEKRP
jgi:hypothetical protein